MDIFLNGFHNPFIVHARYNFFQNQIFISRWWFSVHMRLFDVDFLFFFNFFDLIFNCT